MQARIIFCVVPLLAACAQNDDPLPAMGTLEWDRVELVAEASERIVVVAVSEGDRVATGDLLLQLDDERLRLRLEQFTAARDQAAARLAELRRGPRSEAIDEGRAVVNSARAVLVNADEQLARTRDLVERKVTGAADLDRRVAQRDSAHASLAAAEADLRAMLEGTTLEELQQAQALLAQSEARVQEAMINRSRMRITASRDGVVDSLPYELGEQPPVGAPVVVLLVGSQPFARIYVPASLRVHVKAGIVAQVAIDGLAQPVPGRVRMIRKDATFTPYFALTEHDRSRLSYLAEVVLEGESTADLPAGVPVQVTFPDR